MFMNPSASVSCVKTLIAGGISLAGFNLRLITSWTRRILSAILYDKAYKGSISFIPMEKGRMGVERRSGLCKQAADVRIEHTMALKEGTLGIEPIKNIWGGHL